MNVANQVVSHKRAVLIPIVLILIVKLLKQLSFHFRNASFRLHAFPTAHPSEATQWPISIQCRAMQTLGEDPCPPLQTRVSNHRGSTLDD